jgi:hypothetical protein
MGKHLEKSCGGHAQQCCSQTGCDDPHDTCDGPGGFANLGDPRNTCQCGAHGETCCGGTSCKAGYVCVGDPKGANQCECGDRNQPCCPLPDSGNGNLACVGFFECIGGSCQCGAPGQLCCNDSTCNDGKACVKDARGVGRCPAPPPCGGSGQACCGGTSCNTGLTCSSSKCTPKTLTCSGATATATAQWWPIGLKDVNGCAAPNIVPVFANTVDEAAACVSRANPGRIPDKSGQAPSSYTYAETDSFLQLCHEIGLYAFSSADAQRCAQSDCGNDPYCSVAQGSCPAISHAPLKSCAATGASCGSVSDGMGGVLDCGACPAGLTCGGGGADGVCGCTPLTCETAGAQCGTVSDGCGGTLDCGGCPTGLVCGGSGKPGQCAPACTPRRRCGRFSCGTFDDGCGGTYCCGDVADCCG